MAIIENGNNIERFKNSTYIRRAKIFQMNNLRQFFRTKGGKFLK